MSILTKLFGDPNAREVAKIEPLIAQMGALEPTLQTLSDAGLKAKTAELKARLAEGATLDDILPEAFAVAREASHRVLGQRQYDVQLVGGVALHRGMIAEMRTGEGKTLTAVAAVYLNALSGKGVHVVTVNDYLARRDAVWMGQVYHALGLSIGVVQHEAAFIYDPDFKTEPSHDAERDALGSFRVDMDYLRPLPRKEAYLADITYGTNNEFGFDYLRDNMVQDGNNMVQRELNFAIVDEVDSILIDEARTPLIISAPAEEPTALYYRFAELVARLDASTDYTIDEKLRTASLTEGGITKIEQWLGVDNLYVAGGMRMVHHLEQALRAETLYKKDRDYVVKDGEVIIVDEFTGRLMTGRRWSDGLHQAIEAKERVQIQRESVTMATITFQNLFRLYAKLGGMTGTADTEAEEFHKIHNLEVLTIPTNKPIRRADASDRVYKNQIGKFQAVVKEIKERVAKGQPVLVGTVSIEKNELLSELLRQAGVKHELLNAKNHEREAEIIAQAGKKGAVTVATNMAGRGVDIILGGNPPEPSEAAAVREAGGLHVLGTERHESRRIDNQLRGRAGRQGDPGSTQFYVAMDDDLMRIFGSDKMQKRMEFLGLPDDEAIESRMLSKAIEAAQKKVEGHNFDIRKHLLEYDDVLNKHRTVIYKKRRDVLDLSAEATQEGERPTKAIVMQAIEREMEAIALSRTPEEGATWDLADIEKAALTVLPAEALPPGTLKPPAEGEEGQFALVNQRTAITDALMNAARAAYAKMETKIGDGVQMHELEKNVVLRCIDMLWVDHLEAIDHLRKGIGLQGYGQRDPLVEYKKQAYFLFQEMLGAIDRQIANVIFRVQVSYDIVREAEPALVAQHPSSTSSGIIAAASNNGLKVEVTGHLAGKDGKEPGRNDLCPCGSGKKYKKCHGAI